MEFPDAQWHEFVRYIDHENLLVLQDYKRDQVERRLKGFLLREGYADLPALIEAMRHQPGIAARLKNFLTVHVSEFFRDPPYWQRLATALHDRGFTHGRAWSAGCSWGAEPASFWLMERSHAHQWEIWATDTDVMTLEQAKLLRFPKESLTPLLDPYREWWHPDGEDTFSLVQEAHRDIHWAHHDLLTDKGYPQSFELVMSRYVMIYFSQEARRRVLENLVSSLKMGGLLFIGATETLLDAQAYGLVAIGPALFQRVI
ncbi:MAG: hypothetical protein C7B47_10570 [Sulfobacillus thermosulfidooxidans]|uniref:CheR-type methyltransferase domain-containing protein n=1 Tax=Sulfobacillus thermosulfidooxidans TaxID=28034 RepID=A0A2T2WW55_SULTH|nr:MAG: hypothetical protein C7B47_10570 [Sulfobacillus thermosulfidooxidans]